MWTRREKFIMDFMESHLNSISDRDLCLQKAQERYKSIVDLEDTKNRRDLGKIRYGG
jgi:hypothetical protein